MKFTIERASLLKTLSHMQSIVEKRNTIPVLSNVRIEALSSEISFKATDMDTEITEIVDANISEAGATTDLHSFPTRRSSDLTFRRLGSRTYFS